MDGEGETRCGSFSFEDKEFTVKRGDYAQLMEKVSHYLEKAQVRGGVCVGVVSGVGGSQITTISRANSI